MWSQTIDSNSKQITFKKCVGLGLDVTKVMPLYGDILPTNWIKMYRCDDQVYFNTPQRIIRTFAWLFWSTTFLSINSCIDSVTHVLFARGNAPLCLDKQSSGNRGELVLLIGITGTGKALDESDTCPLVSYRAAEVSTILGWLVSFFWLKLDTSQFVVKYNGDYLL